MILRIGWLCRSGYEWGQHVAIGRRAGLTDEEIARIPKGRMRRRAGAGRAHAPARHRRAARRRVHLGRDLGGARRRADDAQQIMDLVFTVGQYNLVSMALNSFGVQPEPGLAPLPRV